MKQTAVEWLESQVERYFSWVHRGQKFDKTEKDIFDAIELCKAIKQAKEMEKQQLEKVFKDAFIYGLDWNQKEISFDEYYNEQFKNK
jgi:hypothetical protein